MDLITARVIAVTEMKKHGLMDKGWTFEFDRATSRLGLCNFGKRLISISKHFTGAATEDEFRQTLIHEIAHALLPVAAKHGWQWKQKARELGYKGKRTSHNPFHEQEQAKKRVDAFTTKPLPDADWMRDKNVSKTLVTALNSSTGAPKVGDILVLPTGAKLEVREVTPRQTKAVEIGNDSVWNLSTSDAYRFIQN